MGSRISKAVEAEWSLNELREYNEKNQIIMMTIYIRTRSNGYKQDNFRFKVQVKEIGSRKGWCVSEKKNWRRVKFKWVKGIKWGEWDYYDDKRDAAMGLNWIKIMFEKQIKETSSRGGGGCTSGKVKANV